MRDPTPGLPEITPLSLDVGNVAARILGIEPPVALSARSSLLLSRYGLD